MPHVQNQGRGGSRIDAATKKFVMAVTPLGQYEQTLISLQLGFFLLVHLDGLKQAMEEVSWTSSKCMGSFVFRSRRRTSGKSANLAPAEQECTSHLLDALRSESGLGSPYLRDI